MGSMRDQTILQTFREAERGQPCPRELSLRPNPRGHGCPRSGSFMVAMRGQETVEAFHGQ
jgi:hypothetical protein